MYEKTAEALNEVQSILKKHGEINTLAISNLLTKGTLHMLMRKLVEDGIVVQQKKGNSIPSTWKLIGEKHYETTKRKSIYSTSSTKQTKTQDEIIMENLARIRKRKVLGARSSGISLYHSVVMYGG